jgi:hypothetical protein
MIHTGRLDTDRLTEAPPLEVLSYWIDNGYPVNGVVEAHTVVSRKEEAEDTGHIVMQVETLERPLSEADVVEDQTTEWCCSCPAYQYHCNVDLENKRLSEWRSCKHIKSIAKAEKAKADDNQRELTDN